MNLKFPLPAWTSLLALCLFGSSAVALRAGAPALSPTITEPSTRYGLLNGLDHRSQYGKGVFPEPFGVDDTDLEDDELRLDWFSTHGADHASSQVLRAEIEKGFGNLTLELELPYEVDTCPHRTTNGFDNIDVAARYPVFQYVSPNGFFDTTFGVALELGIPVLTAFSKNTEIVPKIFNDTKIGNFTIQSLVGYSMIRGGGGDEAGVDNLEYGVVLGYTIQRPVAGVQQFIPVAELMGEHQLNHAEAGNSNVSADIGFRINLKAIGSWQPRLGIVYAFPLNKGAREDFHSGLFTSLVFEY